jgi:hypothetical protein
MSWTFDTQELERPSRVGWGEEELVARVKASYCCSDLPAGVPWAED